MNSVHRNDVETEFLFCKRIEITAAARDISTDYRHF
jgi:hypothetical protein